MKRNIITKCASIFLVGALLCTSTAIFASPANAVSNAIAVRTASGNTNTDTYDKSISVSGDAKISVDPDMAYISLGVTTKDKTTTGAIAKNAETMKKVMNAIKKQGIVDDDITVQNLNTYPMYEGDASITSVGVSNQIKITVRDLTKLSEIVNKAFEAGVTDFSNIQYDVVDRDKYYAEVVDKAMASVTSKAQTLAKASKMTLGSPISISDNQMGSFYDEYAYGGYGFGATVTEESAVAETVPVNFGDTIQVTKVTISASFYVNFSAK